MGFQIRADFRNRCGKVTTLTLDSVKPRSNILMLNTRRTRLQSAQIQQGADNYSHVFLHRRICTSLTHQFILGLGSLWEQTCCLLLRPHKGLHVACVALEDQCRAARLEPSLCGCWWKLLRLMLRLLQAFVRVAQSSTPMTLSDWATVCTDSELRIFLSSSSPRDPSPHYLEWERDTVEAGERKTRAVEREKPCMWMIRLGSDKG